MSFVLLRSQAFIRNARKVVEKQPELAANIFQLVEYENKQAILLEAIGSHDMKAFEVTGKVDKNGQIVLNEI